MSIVETPFAQRELRYGPEAPVPVFQHEWELSQLLAIYREQQPGNVIEIGTYHGGTLYHWLQNAADGATVVSVDSYAVGVDNRALYAEWVPRGVTLEAIEGNSHDPETIDRVAEFAPFDWIFIDAGHYYPDALEDWANCRDLAAPGAIVAFHDILTHPNHPEIEVEPLWREIQRQGYLTQELVANPGADWGGVGLVFLP